ncbi:hypothetical protein T484DRAFT_1780187 [Baffinella frigidus]|nr:hypothetical protein T484DRAFT_1780187 [Cryptophyta sp. CCMP2293]
MCCVCPALSAAHNSAPAAAGQLISAAGGVALSQDVRFLFRTSSSLAAAYQGRNGHATLLVLRGGSSTRAPRRSRRLAGNCEEMKNDRAFSPVLSPRKRKRPAGDAEAGERAVPLEASTEKRGKEPKSGAAEQRRFGV